jgi:hypothetical protein
MKIRPTDDWKLLGPDIQLDKTKIYYAIPATNQPEFEEKKKIFVQTPRGSMLLEAGEYEIVE